MENQNKKYTTISLKYLVDSKVLIFELSREKALNSLNSDVFNDFKLFFSTFEDLRSEFDIRAIIIMGKGKNFSAGLDLKSSTVKGIAEMQASSYPDIGRKAYKFYNSVKDWQNTLTIMENISVPIIAAIHGYCLGGALSILTSCDFCICTKDAKFGISEMNIGLTADLGSLQRLTKTVKKFGLFKKLSYTGEVFDCYTAEQLGLVDFIYENYNEIYSNAVLLASTIAEKSPIAVWGVKRAINFSRDHDVNTGLEMVATLNSALIQSEDILSSVTSVLTKKKAKYAKF